MRTDPIDTNHNYNKRQLGNYITKDNKVETVERGRTTTTTTHSSFLLVEGFDKLFEFLLNLSNFFCRNETTIN